MSLNNEAVTRGYPARFVAASEMLNDLASVDGSTRQHRFKRYVSPRFLTIDEVGYLRYDTRHTDLLYEVVRQRYKAERLMMSLVDRIDDVAWSYTIETGPESR